MTVFMYLFNERLIAYSVSFLYYCVSYFVSGAALFYGECARWKNTARLKNTTPSNRKVDIADRVIGKCTPSAAAFYAVLAKPFRLIFTSHMFHLLSWRGIDGSRDIGWAELAPRKMWDFGALNRDGGIGSVFAGYSSKNRDGW